MGGAIERPERHDFSDQTYKQSLMCVNPSASDIEIQGPSEAQSARCGLGAGHSRNHTEAGLWKAKAGVSGCDRDIAQQRHFEAATDGVAVHGRDGRYR